MAEKKTHAQRLLADPAKAYLAESRSLLPCSTADPATLGSLGRDAVAADLVLFVKAGCGHCARAEALTESHPSRLVVSLDTAAQRAALAEKLRIPALTTPIVFVRGRCIGGGEELRALADSSGGLNSPQGDFPPDPFAPGVPDVTSWTTRRLCKPPGGTSATNYFLNCYGNTVRGMGVVHALLFAVLAWVDLSAMAQRIIVLSLFVDCALFVLSANVSPVGLSCTSLLWTRRGPVVPAIPYKMIMVYYLVFLTAVLRGELTDGQMQTAAIANALNSAFLGVLRF